MNSEAKCIPTIYDVARMADVSTSSVSRVMNGNTSVSEGIRKRVGKAYKS